MAILELSSEDILRLNVLVKNVEAIRIDERHMTVCGLSARGEAKVPLNPTGRPEQYLKAVREFLSSAALGSPSGYPVHLNRWTRMGQARDTNLARLLMLGESEAIAAVVCAPGLTEELARRAWWVDPTSDTARRMLARPCVVESELGRTLATHLVEHLPFETDPRVIIDSVRLVLQPGLIDSPTRARLWEKGAVQTVYRIGFLEAVPDALPQPLPARADAVRHAGLLADLAADNVLAGLLQRVLSSPGQTFLAVCLQVLGKPSSQEAVVSLLNALSRYFSPARIGDEPCQDSALTVAQAEQALARPAAAALLSAVPGLRAEIVALHALARMDEAIVIPVFARSSASGSLMRRKIEPLIHPVIEQIGVLRRAP